MTTEGIEYFNIGMFFKDPVKASNYELFSKETVILRKEINEDKIIYGEVPLLPWFGTESFDDIKHVMKGGEYQAYRFPALSFGFSQLQIAENYFDDQTLKPGVEKIKLQGFIAGQSIKSDINNCETLKSKFFESVKVKVGPNIPNEIKRLKQIAIILGPDVSLRLDPNGSWNLNDYLLFEKDLLEFNIEYIEQPCMDSDELHQFARKSQIKIAADESVRSRDDLKEIIQHGTIFNIVVKPSLCGGYYRSKKIIELAEENGVEVTLSSAYETGIGKELIVLLASQCNIKQAHGLGNSSWFKNDYESKFFEFINSECFIHEKHFNQFALTF